MKTSWLQWKDANWSGTGTSHDHLDWQRLSYREQFKEEDEEADRGNDGKVTSKNGLALNGTSYYGKLRTARSGGSWLKNHMGYRWRNVISDCRKSTLQLTLKRQKWCIVFFLDCFGDKHIDFLLQIVFYPNTRTWLITFLVDQYHRICVCVCVCVCNFYKFEGRGHNSLTVSSGEIRAPLVQ